MPILYTCFTCFISLLVSMITLNQFDIFFGDLIDVSGLWTLLYLGILIWISTFVFDNCYSKKSGESASNIIVGTIASFITLFVTLHVANHVFEFITWDRTWYWVLLDWFLLGAFAIQCFGKLQGRITFPIIVAVLL